MNKDPNKILISNKLYTRKSFSMPNALHQIFKNSLIRPLSENLSLKSEYLQLHYYVVHELLVYITITKN